MKRKSAGQVEGESGFGQTRKPGGGKAAKLLPKVDNSLQVIPRGKVCKIEGERKDREPGEPSRVLAPGGAKQLIGLQLVQPVMPQGHLAGDSSPSQVRRSVELQIQVQEEAGDSDTKQGWTEKESLKHLVPPSRSEL